MRMDRRSSTATFLGALAMLAAAGSVAAAQGRGPQRVPPGQMPPPGMCRVWYDNLPPGRQPAPTSCREAERRAGRGARVIYGDARYDRRDDRRDDRRGDVRNDRRDVPRYDPRYDPRDGRAEPGRGRAGGEAGRSRVGGGTALPCVDRNRDGYCDSGTSWRSLPVMSRTSTLSRAQRSAVEREWLGSARMTARFTDRDRNGIPEEILWYDQRGALVQRWQDQDRDGRADEITYYRDGRVQDVVRAGR